MAGTLYLVPTPIGNLGDISRRCAETLAAVDFIAAEDTRVTLKLLNHLGLKKPLLSYYRHNTGAGGEAVLERLLSGEDGALVTDAGTPAVSDPGEELVRQCIEAGVEVTSLPGPAACITALTMSGLPTRRFAFEAFLPAEKSDKKERARILGEMGRETRTMVLYEAPHHLLKTLKDLREVLGGDRKLSVCRELTKKHETVFKGTLEEAWNWYEANPPKGECVLVLEGKSREEISKEERKKWEDMSVAEHMELYLSQGMEKKEAMKQVAKDRGVSKRDIYQILLQGS